MAAALISRDEMFELILAADPSFRPRWVHFSDEWGEDAHAPLYLALSSLAEHIAECLRTGSTDNFGAVFSVVERWQIEGDAYVREAASIGLLESLQNLLGGSDRKEMTVERWLGPESRRRWDTLDRFWDGACNALAGDG